MRCRRTAPSTPASSSAKAAQDQDADLAAAQQKRTRREKPGPLLRSGAGALRFFTVITVGSTSTLSRRSSPVGRAPFNSPRCRRRIRPESASASTPVPEMSGRKPPAQGVDHSVKLMAIVLLGADHPSASAHVFGGPAGLISGQRRLELVDPAVYLHTALAEHLQEVFRLVPVSRFHSRGPLVASNKAMHGPQRN
jgi:hypothetical protein